MRTLTSCSERSRRAKAKLISHACSRFSLPPKLASNLRFAFQKIRWGLCDSVMA